MRLRSAPIVAAVARRTLRQRRERAVTTQDDSARKNALARRLAEETGITVVQAEDLIEMLGTNHGSLVREARILRRRTGKPPKS